MKKNLLIACLAVLVSLPAAGQRKYYQRMADSEMKRSPEAWMLDFSTRPNFGYVQGLGCLAILKVWEQTGERKYYDYVHQYMNFMVNDAGEIHAYDYRTEPYNLDMLNAGKVLFPMYKETGEEKYKKALDLLCTTAMTHPHNTLGGFWHKQVYPWQMWLDGLYMASPFLAQYAAEFDRPEVTDLVVKQFLLVREHMWDAQTGLYYHAWDEARRQRWADPETGLSHEFWGRSIGWWFMALVDVLDYLPEDHLHRPTLIGMIQRLADDLPKFQKDGLWYQVVNKGTEEGNYLEASVSAMFMYGYAKSVNKGYLAPEYLRYAEAAFGALTTTLMREDPDGTLNMLQCCAVGGLGGNPYRDGSYDYYIHERVRENDTKATGAFILGCLEMSK
jgi:unsaturated rhamnogalacturonyl hydrolase